MLLTLVRRARGARWVNLAVVFLRYLIAFAFVPAALKKVLDQPFTDPSNHGPFHDFLHALRATGWFYPFVGIMQITASVLLFTQRFATLGALLALPIITTITVFCWSTGVYPTASIATMMWLGTVGLVMWDYEKWRAVFARDGQSVEVAPVAGPIASPGVAGARSIAVGGAEVIDMVLWTRCGIAMLVIYFGSAIARGGVYRPRGMELDEPAFYVMPVVMLLPIVTLVIEQRRRAARKKATIPA